MGLCACDKCPNYTDVAAERIIDGKPYIFCEACDSTLVCERCENIDTPLFSTYKSERLVCEKCRDFLDIGSEGAHKEAKP